jgi:hypothetical protein
MTKFKKYLPWLLVLLVVVGGVFAYTRFRSDSTEETEATSSKKRIQEPVNQIPVSERPYLTISPHADGHNITLAVETLKLPAEIVEYELEYQAGSLLQGAFGQFELNNLPAREQILLGSCSAGGACSYHEDVKGGSLLTRFSGDKETYALKSRWKYIINSEGETSFTSQDAKFQLESDDLARHSYLVIFNTAGYPAGLKAEPVSEIYSLTSASSLTGSGQLSIRAEEEGQLVIMGYDGQDWIEFETSVDGKTATAEVDLLELYTVLKE